MNLNDPTDGITDFGIALAEHCNLVFCSFVLEIDWSKKTFLTEHAITCGVNGLPSFIRLWCNARIVAIGRKVRLHHTLPFMTKQRSQEVRESLILISNHSKTSFFRRSQGGPKGPWPSQTFRKCSNFVLWEAFFQTKLGYSPNIKHFGPLNFFRPPIFLGWLRHC